MHYSSYADLTAFFSALFATVLFALWVFKGADEEGLALGLQAEEPAETPRNNAVEAPSSTAEADARARAKQKEMELEEQHASEQPESAADGGSGPPQGPQENDQGNGEPNEGDKPESDIDGQPILTVGQNPIGHDDLQGQL